MIVYNARMKELQPIKMEYKQMADAYGYSEEKSIQRLPIYLTGLARSVFINMEDKSIWAKGLMIGDVGRMLRQQFHQRKQRAGELDMLISAYQKRIITTNDIEKSKKSNQGMV